MKKRNEQRQTPDTVIAMSPYYKYSEAQLQKVTPKVIRAAPIIMERGFDDDDEFDGGEVIAIGDPEVPILPAEKNANQILAEIILDGGIKLGTRKSYTTKFSHTRVCYRTVIGRLTCVHRTTKGVLKERGQFYPFPPYKHFLTWVSPKIRKVEIPDQVLARLHHSTTYLHLELNDNERPELRCFL